MNNLFSFVFIKFKVDFYMFHALKYLTILIKNYIFKI